MSVGTRVSQFVAALCGVDSLLKGFETQLLQRLDL